MTTTEQRLADALREALDTLQSVRDCAEYEAHRIVDEHDSDEARQALAEYDAQQAQAPTWTVFIRDMDSDNPTTYITSVQAATVDEARALASAECSEDWDHTEDDELHILGVAKGEIGQIVEWEDYDNA